jgi:hypothetical protein
LMKMYFYNRTSNLKHFLMLRVQPSSASVMQ